MKTPRFLSDKKEIALFLTLSMIFAVIFITIYSPLGMKENAELINGISFPAYTAFVVGIGYVTLLLSRVILYFVLKKQRFHWWQYLIWMVTEIIIFTIILALLANQLQNRNVPFMTLAGRILLDIIGILTIPFSITILLFMLREKNHELKSLVIALGKRPSQPQPALDSCMFYNQNGKFVFSTKSENVLFLESADNYVNVNYINEGKVERVLLHNTLKNLEDNYSDKGLIRCHRGFIVNIHKVKVVRKQKDLIVLELYDTDTIVPVSKSYTDQVLSVFAENGNEA